MILPKADRRWLVAALSIASACSSSEARPDAATPEADGGVTHDAAGLSDAGSSQDAGGAHDTGVAYDAGAGQPAASPNILLLIADDFGVESSVCYSATPSPAPRLAAFCPQAVVFDHAWSSPTCSPTRAGVLTGRHSFRTGIGEQHTRSNGLALGAGEWTLPRVLDAAGKGYAHANFGKWHLGGDDRRPNDMGWGHFSGITSGAIPDYERWTKVTDGASESVTTYATTEIVDDALQWIGAQSTPWLAWVAFNAPHSPFHLPPAGLHTQNLSGDAADIAANPEPYYDAAVEALDHEIGRLIDSLEADVRDNTTVIFIGDNGTPGQVSEYAAPRAKESLHEGGVHVPMMIWGAGVRSAGRSSALVSTTDLFATILDLAGVEDLGSITGTTALDSQSLGFALEGAAGGSRYILSELFGSVVAADKQGKTIRDAQHKLIEFSDGRTRFYDLARDPTGASAINAGNRTVDQQAAFDRLAGVLGAWTASPDAPRAE